MLVNTHNDSTIGFMVERTDPDYENLVVKEYEPAIMWNMAIKRYDFSLHYLPYDFDTIISSYISAPPESCSYRAYRCDVKIAGGSSFLVNFKASDFQTSFRKCHETITNKTFGRLVLNRPFENNLWTEFVPKLLFDVKDIIAHQRPAKNIGLQFDYLQEKAFEHRGVLQLQDVEVVYPDVVYDGYGHVKVDPVHCVINEACHNKVLTASRFTPSGLHGLLKIFLPPYTATSSMRRKQQQIAIMGAIGNSY